MNYYFKAKGEWSLLTGEVGKPSGEVLLNIREDDGRSASIILPKAEAARLAAWLQEAVK